MNLILKLHELNFENARFFPSQKIITKLIISINRIKQKSPFNYTN